MTSPKWQHSPGDTYSVVVCQFVGDEETGYRSSYSLLAGPFESRATAWRHGVSDMGHDDFNLAAVRDGQLVAMIWNDEIVDDGADVLAVVSEQTGLPGPAPEGGE